MDDTLLGGCRFSVILEDNIQMHFPETKSVKLSTNSRNMNVWGISDTILKNVQVTQGPSQFDTIFDMKIPKISMISDYKAVGNSFSLLLLAIDTNGHFTSKFEGLNMKFNWTSTAVIENGRVHLLGKLELISLTIKNMKIYFAGLFKNNTELTENTNQVINKINASLDDEISPVVRETISSVVINSVNNVHNLCSFDVSFSTE